MVKRTIATFLACLGMGSFANAASLLGTTTPFSKTALCQRVGCVIMGNAQVGGYLFTTYAVKDSYSVGSSGYFSFLRNGRTVAVGVYALGSQDFTMAGSIQDLKDLVGLTDRPMPTLKGAMGSPSDLPEVPGFPVKYEQVLRRDRNVTLPLGGGMVLTNKSQRIALGNDASKFSSTIALRFIDVAYVALAGDVELISRVINRWSPTDKRSALQAYMKGVGLRALCPVASINGRNVKLDDFQLQSKFLNWPVAHGYTLNLNATSGFALPGLALSTIEIAPTGGDGRADEGLFPACIR